MFVSIGYDPLAKANIARMSNIAFALRYFRTLPFIHISPNGLAFVSNIYSCFVISEVKNYFVIEPKILKKQIRSRKR